MHVSCLCRLLQRDPKKRITTGEGLKHTWLVSAANETPLQSGLLIDRLRAFTEMSKLQGLLMNVIAKNMSTDGIDALRNVFDELVRYAACAQRIAASLKDGLH